MSPFLLKAMCLLRQDERILVFEAFNHVKQQRFYRLLGGHIEFQETAEAAVRREIREEIDSELDELRLVDIIENIYTYQGQPGHEVDFLFEGRLRKRQLYSQELIHIRDTGIEFDAVWVPLAEILANQTPLYPPYDYARLVK